MSKRRTKAPARQSKRRQKARLRVGVDIPTPAEISAVLEAWCINQAQHGRLGLPPKVVQVHMGHSSITMTMDAYGRLFPSTNDSDALATAEEMLLSAAHPTQVRHGAAFKTGIEAQ